MVDKTQNPKQSGPGLTPPTKVPSRPVAPAVGTKSNKTSPNSHQRGKDC